MERSVAFNTVDSYWKERYAVLNTKYEQLYDKG